MEENYLNIISNIKEKITEIILKLESLKDENSKLKEEKESLKKEIEEKETQIRTLETNYNNSKLAGALVSNDGNTEAKKKINVLVREIDNCIALLNR